MVEADPVADTKQDDINVEDDALKGDQAQEEPDVYSQATKADDLFFDAKAIQFQAKDPHDFHGHIVYDCTGVDLQGGWECKRRYNEFHALHEALLRRWPGIVIPLVPPKKAVGNKGAAFVQERRFYLERFLRKMSKYDFIINSQEFQIFARPQGLDIMKSLERLPRLTSPQMYDRLKEATMTDDSELSDRDRDMYDSKLTEFAVYIKKADPFLKKMKGDLARYLTKKQVVMRGYAAMSNTLVDYENNSLAYYRDQDVNSLVFAFADYPRLDDQFKKSVESLKNPFTDLYHWIKGEIYDLQAFQVALNARKASQNAVKELEKKIKQTKADINNVSAGKKTVNTLFKNTGDVHKMQSNLETYERDHEAQKKIYDVMTVYQAQTVMPQFKKEKLALYTAIIQHFSVIEISNSHNSAKFWSEVLKRPVIQSANKVDNM